MSKSTTFARSPPSRSFAIMMLSGFMSRCTMPISCAASRAEAAWIAMRAARSIGSGPSRSSRLVRLSPSTSSMARNCSPSDVSLKS